VVGAAEFERWALGRAMRSRLGELNTDLRSFPPSHAAIADGCLVHQPAGGLVWGGAPAAGLFKNRGNALLMMLIFFGGSIAATIAGISRARR
jgi:hypothetical protein